jgi:hypothetical protein
VLLMTRVCPRRFQPYCPIHCRVAGKAHDWESIGGSTD